tara:strand:- start:133 stop:456 length:324 start_codon:yes stop_codon:yes gene_type:complete
MKITRRQLRILLKEIAQHHWASPSRVLVREEITAEILDNIIAVLPIWESGEYKYAFSILEDLHSLPKEQANDLLMAASEMKKYGQYDDSLPMWIINYFYEKFHNINV